MQATSVSSASTFASRLKEKREAEEARKSEHRTVLLESAPLASKKTSRGVGPTSSLKLRAKSLAQGSPSSSPRIGALAPGWQSRSGTPVADSSAGSQPGSPSLSATNAVSRGAVAATKFSNLAKSSASPVSVAKPPTYSPDAAASHRTGTKASPSLSEKKAPTLKRKLIQLLAKGSLSHRDIMTKLRCTESAIRSPLSEFAYTAKTGSQEASKDSSPSSSKIDRGMDAIWSLTDSMYQHVRISDWPEYTLEDRQQVMRLAYEAFGRLGLNDKMKEMATLLFAKSNTEKGRATMPERNWQAATIRRLEGENPFSEVSSEDEYAGKKRYSTNGLSSAKANYLATARNVSQVPLSQESVPDSRDYASARQSSLSEDERPVKSKKSASTTMNRLRKAAKGKATKTTSSTSAKAERDRQIEKAQITSQREEVLNDKKVHDQSQHQPRMADAAASTAQPHDVNTQRVEELRSSSSANRSSSPSVGRQSLPPPVADSNRKATVKSATTSVSSSRSAGAKLSSSVPPVRDVEGKARIARMQNQIHSDVSSSDEMEESRGRSTTSRGVAVPSNQSSEINSTSKTQIANSSVSAGAGASSIRKRKPSEGSNPRQYTSTSSSAESSRSPSPARIAKRPKSGLEAPTAVLTRSNSASSAFPLAANVVSTPSRQGVGAGAISTAEPWLDVRNNNDWSKLSQRYKRVFEEYRSALDTVRNEEALVVQEMEILKQEEEQAAEDTGHLKSGLPSSSPEEGRPGRNEEDQRATLGKEGEESEEGEASPTARSAATFGPSAPDLSFDASSQTQPTQQTVSTITSSSPEREDPSIRYAWRSKSSQGGSEVGPGSNSYHGGDRRENVGPIPFTELKTLVDTVQTLHGQLIRMKQTLISSKDRLEETAAAAC